MISVRETRTAAKVLNYAVGQSLARPQRRGDRQQLGFSIPTLLQLNLSAKRRFVTLIIFSRPIGMYPTDVPKSSIMKKNFKWLFHATILLPPVTNKVYGDQQQQGPGDLIHW